LSSSTLRRVGLCEDHFTPQSFNTKSKIKGLKRDAIPIPFNSNAQTYSERLERENLNTQTPYIKENIAGLSQWVEENPVTFMPVSNNVTDTQLLQKPPPKTYKPSRLHFDISAKEEDIMEWIHLEPPMHKSISAVLHNNANKEKEKNNNKKKE